MNSRRPAESTLLSREAFQHWTFLRSKGQCVFCDKPAVNAHHILERKLFQDGGYYLGNSAAVCEEHHWDCETTVLSVDEVRAAAGIVSPVIPMGLNPEEKYDKWGNRVWPSGLRSAGPLHNDEGARKALARGNKLHLVMPANYREAPEGDNHELE